MIIEEKAADKAPTHSNPYLLRSLLGTLEPSPALGASVRDTSAASAEMEAEISVLSTAEAGADPASNPQPSCLRQAVD